MVPKETFFEAVENGDIGLVRALLSKDADLAFQRADNGLSAAMLARYNGHDEIVRLLLEQGVVTDIFEAAALGQISRVNQLLQQDPGQVNAFAPDGFTPLGLAAFFGNINTLKALLEQGAEVNLRSQNELNAMPLHSAVASRQTAVARILLEHGADVNARYLGGYTPLHAAAENGQVELVQLLLDYGANPEVTKDDGMTPLKLAELQGFTEVIDLLRHPLQKKN